LARDALFLDPTRQFDNGRFRSAPP
jgi:hypothetical protein